MRGDVAGEQDAAGGQVQRDAAVGVAWHPDYHDAQLGEVIAVVQFDIDGAGWVRWQAGGDTGVQFAFGRG